MELFSIRIQRTFQLVSTGSHKGAERGAILYTIALTCRMNKVNLFEYLTDVINRTAEWQPNTPLEKYRQLLPDRWND